MMKESRLYINKTVPFKRTKRSVAVSRQFLLPKAIEIKPANGVNTIQPANQAETGSFPSLVDIEVNASKGYHAFMLYKMARVPRLKHRAISAENPRQYA